MTPLTRLFLDAIRPQAEARDDQPHPLRDLRPFVQSARAAASEAPVLVHDVSGSGGGALAQAIHLASSRHAGPCLQWSCGQAEAGLLAAMGEAQGGSFLVRDVERLAAADQEALVERLRARGGPVFRLIATTTRDLAEPVRAARFNADLYYRLQIVPVTLTAPASLAERLVHVGRALVASFAREEGKDLSGLTGEAEALVAAHDWPGGWRQLENTLFRAVLLAEGAVITAADLPRLSSIGEPRSAHRTPISAPDAIARPAPLRSPHLLTLMGERGELRSFAELEAEVLRFAMNHYNGHISAISQHLRIGRSTLYRKLKELGLGADGMAA